MPTVHNNTIGQQEIEFFENTLQTRGIRRHVHRLSCFPMDGKHFEMGAFRKPCYSLPDFSPFQTPQ